MFLGTKNSPKTLLLYLTTRASFVILRKGIAIDLSILDEPSAYPEIIQPFPEDGVSDRTVMPMSKVFIAEIESIIPTRYSTLSLADKMYPPTIYGDKVNQLARKLAFKFGIEYRSSVIDYDRYPTILLADPENHPKAWGSRLINTLTTIVGKKEIGLFSLSYNISCHTDTLPNLASQIIMDAELTNLEKNEELACYGCAAAIFSLQQAIAYCRQCDRPAIVFTFDQCTAKCLQLTTDDVDFRQMLLSNLLFSDAGVGLLVIPERMRMYYRKPLLRIIDSQTMFRPGNLINMKNGKFLTNSNLKEIMPRLASEALMKPFLAKNQLNVNAIDEWSIHQGGSEIISQFCRKECLNLSENQIERSLKLFHKGGNTGAASSLMVLESFFNDPQKAKINKSKGIIFGFGAGYYLGALLYEWETGFT